MKQVTFARIKGRVVPKFRGGRSEQVIPDKRKRKPKHRPNYKAGEEEACSSK